MQLRLRERNFFFLFDVCLLIQLEVAEHKKKINIIYEINEKKERKEV